MFSVSKKIFLLPIISFTILQTQCHEPSKRHTFSVEDKPSKETSSYWETGKFLASIITPIIINHLYQKYTQDPELTALNKQEKQIELQIKSHPDYTAISLQQQKNKSIERAHRNKEKELELGIKEAQLIQHHKDELVRFLRCDQQEGFTADYCSYLVKLHKQQLERFELK
jgi:hypothetical protein